MDPAGAGVDPVGAGVDPAGAGVDPAGAGVDPGLADGHPARSDADATLVALAALADRQHGVVSHGQLADLGLSKKAIDRRRRRHDLRPLYRGVYALGHLALRREARWLAAVLAYGDGALLCGPVAAMEWWMVAPDEDAEPSVMVVGRQARQRPGTSLHRVARLEPEDVRLRDGIPLTSPARTLLDLAGMWPERPVQLAFDEGRRRGVVTPRAVARVLERYPRRPGAELLRDLARPDRPSELTRSPAEEWLLPHLRRSGLPAPEWNARLGAFTVDCLWRAQRLVVEVDGYPFHTGRSAFERDHEKDLVMRRMRLDVMRFTARQVKREPLRVIVDIAGELARRHPPV